MILSVEYFRFKLGVLKWLIDTYTNITVIIITLCIVLVILIFVGGLIFEENYYDRGFAEEPHRKLDYIIYRIERKEE